MRCVRFDHVTSFIVNPDDTPVTIIEIRRFRNGWKCFEAPGVEPVFLDQEQAIDYAKNCACFVMMGEPVQFELHEREQFLQRSLVSAAPVAEQLGDLSSRGWGVVNTSCSTPRILAWSRDFYSTAEGRSKKTAHSWRVSGGLSALA